MCLDWLRSKLCKCGMVSPPNFLEDISGSEVFSIIEAEFPNGTKFISDVDYKTTTVEEIERFLKEDITDKDKYVSEMYDCEDFSFRLMGQISNPSWGCLPFGVIYVKQSKNNYHAVNCFIDSKREVWLIEPQNDDIFKCPERWECVMIII